MSETAEEKQCRICFDGPAPELGRLIRPCLCKGSISVGLFVYERHCLRSDVHIKYVHVKCLHRWRKASSLTSAFYSCPQCHYQYRFARTFALGIASNPCLFSKSIVFYDLPNSRTVFVAILSILLFTILVYCASFLATVFMDDLDYSPGVGVTFFDTFWLSPSTVASNLMGIVLRILRDEDIILDQRESMPRTSYTRPPIKISTRRSVLGNFVRRVIIGIPVVGVASLVQLLWSLSMLGPFHIFTQLRGRNRRESTRDIATIIILLAIILGAIR